MDISEFLCERSDLDTLLDKISDQGITSLTPDEKRRLDMFSRGEVPKTEKKEWFYEINGIGVKFIFDKCSVDKRYGMFKVGGALSLMGKVFVGCFEGFPDDDGFTMFTFMLNGKEYDFITNDNLVNYLGTYLKIDMLSDDEREKEKSTPIWLWFNEIYDYYYDQHKTDEELC